MLAMWTKLINDLTQSGFTLRDIQARTGLAPSSLSELRSGKTSEPMWTAGQKLVEMHDSEMNSLHRRKRKSAA